MKSQSNLVTQLIGIIVCTMLTKTHTSFKKGRQCSGNNSMAWSVFQRINEAVLLREHYHRPDLPANVENHDLNCLFENKNEV